MRPRTAAALLSFLLAAGVFAAGLFAAGRADAWIDVNMSVIANASLTKVADDTYDFSYGLFWNHPIPPSAFPESGSDPVTGVYSYFLPYQTAYSSVEGHFGVPTDLTGQGFGYQDAYLVPAPQGSFRFNGTPGVFNLTATQDIAVEYYTAGGDFITRDLVGTMTGSTHLFGALPANIGDTTEWAATPEPPTWMLLGTCLGLLLMIRAGSAFRLKRSALGRG